MNEKREPLKDRLYLALSMRGKKAVDLTRDLQIPKSAVSQYLSGKSQNMDSERLYKIARYLDVSEPWLLGFEVPMERNAEKKNTQVIAAMSVRLRKDEEFLSVVSLLNDFDKEKLQKAKQILQLL
jgi:transcriptional regulator with XRE-family HTH domain